MSAMAMLRNSGCHQGCAKMPWVAWCSWCALLCSVVGDISAPEVVVPSVAQMQRDSTWTDCGVSPWADWTVCTTSCGTGTRDQGFRPLFTVSHQPNAHSGQMTRARSIATARSDKGAACPALQVPHTQGRSTGRINCACQRYRRAGRVARRPSSEGNATSGLPRTRTLARNKNFAGTTVQAAPCRTRDSAWRVCLSPYDWPAGVIGVCLDSMPRRLRGAAA